MSNSGRVFFLFVFFALAALAAAMPKGKFIGGVPELGTRAARDVPERGPRRNELRGSDRRVFIYRPPPTSKTIKK